MNEYRVSYKEDHFTTVDEIKITCSEDDIERLADKYYEENKDKLSDVVGMDWQIIK